MIITYVFFIECAASAIRMYMKITNSIVLLGCGIFVFEKKNQTQLTILDNVSPKCPLYEMEMNTFNSAIDVYWKRDPRSSSETEFPRFNEANELGTVPMNTRRIFHVPIEIEMCLENAAFLLLSSTIRFSSSNNILDGDCVRG